MKKLKQFSDLEFSDAFLFGAVMEDEQGTIYDIEMQTTDKGNLPKRSRCYQGQMDVAALEPGTDFRELPQSYIIFICTFDPFGKGLYCYTYLPVCQENGDELQDGTCRIFLNTRGTNEHHASPQLIDFLHFVADNNSWMQSPEDGLLQRLQQRICYLKHSRRLEERYMLFGEILDDERREGLREGLREGQQLEHSRMLALIQAMIDDGKSQEVFRLASDSGFYEEMREQYPVVQSQKVMELTD